MSHTNGASNGTNLAAKSANSLSNGHGTSTLPSSNGKASAAAKPLLKRPGGGIKVSTIKRAPAPPARPSPLASGSASPASNGSASQKRLYNALPEETRRRVEELRLEKERKRREEEERHRPKHIKKREIGSSSPPKKRKPKRETLSSDDDSDEQFAGDSPRKLKQQKSSRGSSAQGDSSCYKRLGRVGVAPHYLVPRDLLNKPSFGPVVEDDDEKPIQGADLLATKSCGIFFRGLEGETRVQLEYPADGCTEEFLLMVPKDRDEYDPISDLLRTVRCIVEFYLTHEQQALFGTLDSFETSSAAGNVLSSATGNATPAERIAISPMGGTAASSREGTPATVTSIDAALTISTTLPSTSNISGTQSVPLSPARSAIRASTTAASSPMPVAESMEGGQDRDPILRSFTKARNRRDGPLFLRTVERFNTTLRALKETGKIRENVEAMSPHGVAEGIWRCVQEQCYARTVAPRVDELSKYEAFSDNVYGELLPRFMSEIAQLTALGPASVFVDLGSGVGNLLIQVALQTGSQAFGCEQMASPSALAAAQIAEAERRWRMWGLNGARTEAWMGDFGEDERVRDVLRRADVVLVNNYAFTARTNDKLSLQFLDLKDGAHIVSLKPFVPPDFRLTERTLSSPLAILRVAQRMYTSGCVSWADGGGRYYIHTVDRSLVAKFLEQHGDMALAEITARKRQWKRAIDEDDNDDERGERKTANDGD